MSDFSLVPHLVAVTPAQKKLIEFCRHIDAPELGRSLETTLDKAIFHSDDVSCEERQQMYLVKQLQKRILDVEREGIPEHLVIAN
ncbi:MAG: hypothetical protein WBG71_00090 [Leeuwenhoekiella sp.]